MAPIFLPLSVSYCGGPPGLARRRPVLLAGVAFCRPLRRWRSGRRRLLARGSRRHRQRSRSAWVGKYVFTHMHAGDHRSLKTRCAGLEEACALPVCVLARVRAKRQTMNANRAEATEAQTPSEHTRSTNSASTLRLRKGQEKVETREPLEGSKKLKELSSRTLLVPARLGSYWSVPSCRGRVRHLHSSHE